MKVWISRDGNAATGVEVEEGDTVGDVLEAEGLRFADYTVLGNECAITEDAEVERGMILTLGKKASGASRK